MFSLSVCVNNNLFVLNNLSARHVSSITNLSILSGAVAVISAIIVIVLCCCFNLLHFYTDYVLESVLGLIKILP